MKSKAKGYILLVDSSVKNELSFRLLSHSKVEQAIMSVEKLDQQLLPAISKFLKSNKVALKNIQALGVVNDAGSFVSQRIALTVLNTLGWANGILIFPLKHQLYFKIDWQTALIASRQQSKPLVLPNYLTGPTITPSKRQYHFNSR